MQPNTEYNIGLTKHVIKRLNLNNNCLPIDGDIKKGYDHIKCKENYTANLLKQTLHKNNNRLCWIPQADFFIKQMNISSIEACNTRENMKTINDVMQQIMSKAEREIISCPEPCTTDRFSITENENPIFSEKSVNVTEMYLSWDDLNVLVEEEYLLLDFNAIVSAVGGSIGLLLGFSCLDFLLKLLSKIEAYT